MMRLGRAELNTNAPAVPPVRALLSAIPVVALEPSKVDFIRKMGGHAGVDIRLNQLRTRSLAELKREA